MQVETVLLCQCWETSPSNGAAGRAGGLNMAFDPHKAKNAGAEGLLVGDLLFQKV